MEGTTVKLRAVEESDLPLVRQWNFDPDITRFFPSRWPVSMAEQKSWFDKQTGAGNSKRLIVMDGSTSRPIGLVAAMNIDHINKNCEIGITIGDATYWGKPHSVEAIRLLVEFLFSQLNMHLIYLRVMEDNKRATAFFQKCGFTSGGLLRDMVFTNGAYHSWLWMSITQPEFASRRVLSSEARQNLAHHE